MEEPDDRHPAIRRAVRALAEDDEALAPSTFVELRLRAELRAIGEARRRRTTQSVIGVAAAAVLAVGIAWWRRDPAAPTPVSPSRAVNEVTTELLPLPYASVPTAQGHTVRLEVPRSALLAFGFGTTEAMREGGASGIVLADVFVGEDGLARSVRFVLPAAEEKRP